jgi:hypothetical protein
MKITRLLMENFRGAPDGAWSFTGPEGAPLDTVIVTGPPSSGKTAFLEAIAALKESVGAYDMPPITKRLLRRGAAAGRLEGTWRLTPEETARAGVDQSTVTTALDLGGDGPAELAGPGLRALFKAYDHDPAHGKLEYFPANRSVCSPAGARPRSVEEEASLRPGKAPEKYAPLRRALVDLGLSDGVKAIEEAAARGLLLRSDQRDSLGPYRRALADLCPGIRLVGVEAIGGGHDLVFERADGGRLTLDDLSESEKQAFLFCATFLRIGLSHSIVLVDEPELHLHTDRQLAFVRALGRLGVDNQIFLATGSLEIAGAAQGNVVRLEKGGGGRHRA